MKTTAMAMPELKPALEVELFQDKLGNWFCSVWKEEEKGTRVFCTATYTEPQEAFAEVVARCEL